MTLERAQRHELTLHELHGKLRDLYRAEYPHGAPYLFEALQRKLPSYIRALVRRKLDLIVSEEIGKYRHPQPLEFVEKWLPSALFKILQSVRERFATAVSNVEPQRSHDDLGPTEKRALSMFLDPQVLRAFIDVNRDSALSNDGHSISHFETLPPIVAHELIKVASIDNPESLARTGCVFFDVDGTKTIVDCTSHAHAGKYLEGLAEFLCTLNPIIRDWLLKNNLSSEAYSVAGDEFVVLLRSRDAEITKQVLDEFAALVQKQLASDPVMTSFITFDDPEFVMEYDEWSDDDKAAYKADSSSRSQKLRESRDKLPDRFVPSVSAGSATFIEALREAFSPHTETASTLEDLGIDAFRIMVATADQRLKEDKREFRANLQDPKLKAFLLRNSENRRLQYEIDELRARIAELEGSGSLSDTIQQ